MTDLNYEDEDVEQDQIEVHWQHPRTELEQPLLLVWPHPVLDQWAAELEDGTATVTVHEWLVDVADDPEKTEVEKRAEAVEADDEIPAYLADALLEFEGNYGPVSEVVNPVADDGDSDCEEAGDDQQRELSEVANVE
jgi:hypothetical protein